MYRFSPSPDPSLIIKFYERTPEQQASLGYVVDPSQSGDHCDGPSTEETSGVSDEVKREPHGSVGATAAHRAIAQSNSSDIVENVFRYSAPEEVRQLLKFNWLSFGVLSVYPQILYGTSCLVLFDR